MLPFGAWTVDLAGFVHLVQSFCRFHFLAAFVERQFLVQAGDHLADAGLAETVAGSWMFILQAGQPLLLMAQLLFRRLVLLSR